MLYLGVIKAGIRLGLYCMVYGCLGVYDTLYRLILLAFSEEGRSLVKWYLVFFYFVMVFVQGPSSADVLSSWRRIT